MNQIEVSPFLRMRSVVDYCKQEDIVVEAYSPLTQGKKLAEPVLVDMAKKYVCMLYHTLYPIHTTCK